MLMLSGLVVSVMALIAPAAAQTVSGPTTSGLVCMQRVYGGPTVSNANRLGCTANDIKIARAITAVDAATGKASCVEGETFDLLGTFQVNVTANERYDAAFFFNTGGGANARDVNGTCSESILRNPTQADPNVPVLNLDQDVCGDLNAGSYDTITFLIPDVLCQDSDLNGFLNLPNCTSWHSNRSTVCSGFSTAAPETKSKCNCDDTFEVPVTIESPSGAVVKKATKAVVSFQVEVKNNSKGRTVKINSLVDDLYGDITQVQGEVLTTNCADLIGDTLAPGATSAACTFTVEYADPGTSGDLTNTVTAGLEDTGNASKVDVTGSTTINVELNVTP
jgi:hypothetical protein